MNWQEAIEHPSLQNLPFKIELNEYGKIEMGPASNRHGRLQSKILLFLEHYGKQGELYLECSINTRKGIARLLQPPGQNIRNILKRIRP